MSFKRGSMDEDADGGFDNDSQPFKRQRFDDDNGGFRGRGRGRGGDRGRGGGRGRGRGDGFRGGGRGGGFRRGRGGFDRDNDGGGFRRGGGGFDRDNDGGGFRGRGRGRGGGRGFDGGRGGRGRGRGGDRGGGFRGRGGGGFGNDNRFNYAQRESIIKLNQDAPSFDAMNDKSESVSLQQFRGQYVVLFIYFKNGTFGCSTEQKCFRDLKEKFDEHNAVILGVSRDDTSSHQAAIEEHNLNFSLITDSNGKISKSYGALDDDDRVVRCTFIISPEGKVVALWPKVFGFERHAQEVLGKLEEIGGGGAEHDNTKKRGENEENDDNEENDEDNEAEDNEDNEDDGDDQEEDDDNDDE